MSTVNKPSVSVSCIVLHESKVLIGKVSEGLWETPTVPLRYHESTRDAAFRSSFELAGIQTEPQGVLFVSEYLVTGTHDVVIYIFSKYIGGTPKTGGDWVEALWVDVRELAKYQDTMSDLTVDAFYKFSIYLQSASAKAN